MARSRASANYTITATDRTRAGIQSAKGAIAGLDDIASKLGVSFSLMAAAGAAAPGAIITAQAPLIQQMGRMTQTLGFGVEAFQSMSLAAEAAGISMDDLYGSAEEALLRISEAINLGAGEAAEGLQLLGIAAQDLAQLKPEDRIYAVLEALEQVEDAGDKILLADKVFGGSGIAATRLLTENIDEAAASMERLGLVLNSADIRGVDTMNRELLQTQALIGQAAKVFTAQMAPSITGVTRTIFGATDSMAGFRDTSIAAADFLADFVGFAGDLFNDVRRGITGMEYAFQEAGVAILGFLDTLPGIDLEQKWAEEAQKAAAIYSKLADIPGVGEFSESLRENIAAARAEAEATATSLDALREKTAKGLDVPVSLQPTDEGAAATDAADSAFESLLDGLATGTEKIDREYAKRLSVIDEFRSAFPDRANEALQAEIASLEERDRAIEEYEQQKKDREAQEQEAALAPLEANYENIRKQFQAENEIILEEYENRKELLQELAEQDLERRAEINELLVQLAQDKEERIAAIEARAVSGRIQIQSEYAAKALGVAASLVDSIAGEGERGKRIAARISQAEALVAGISAAERARNHAALTGGVVSGGAAAALSWASTLANVAGIEAALNGSAPGGVSSSGGVPSSGTTGDIDSALTAGAAESMPINVTFVLDDTVFNRDAIERMAAQGVAKGTQSRELTYNTRRDYYEYNTEGVA